MLICVTVLILKHDLLNYFHIGNVNTQNNVDEPGPRLVVEPPPQGLFPLSDKGPIYFVIIECQVMVMSIKRALGRIAPPFI